MPASSTARGLRPAVGRCCGVAVAAAGLGDRLLVCSTHDTATYLAPRRRSVNDRGPGPCYLASLGLGAAPAIGVSGTLAWLGTLADAALGPGTGAHMLLDEHMRVELGDPLLAFDGALEMLQRRADVGLDHAPEEARIALGEIGGRLEVEPLGDAGLDELVEQRVQLARIVGIGELADQVGGADQAGLGMGVGVVVVLGHREAGQLDRPGDPVGVEMLAQAQAMVDEDLAALDVVGREERVRGAARRGHGVARLVDHEAALGIAGTDAAQIADVVAQRRHREVQPVGVRDLLGQHPAAQHRLADQGDHDRVLGVVVERVAVGDPLDHELGARAQDGGIFGAAIAEHVPVVAGPAPRPAHSRRDARDSTSATLP